MTIESDCGNYVHGWMPTPNSESFLHLLSRMDQRYLLYKISNETVIDGESTAGAILELVKDCAEGECIELSDWDLEQITDACHHHSDERDLVEAVLDAIIYTSLRRELQADTYSLYSSVVKDYPTNAKKIVEVFYNCIRPVLKALEVQDGK